MSLIRRSHRLLLVTAAAIATATSFSSSVTADGPGQSFAFLHPSYTQQLYGASANLTDPMFGILGGVAFAPDGDVWSTECVFNQTRLHRFDSQTTITINETAVHPEIVVQTQGGCGVVNHPDQSLYSNSSEGIWQLNAETGAAIRLLTESPAGSALGIAVDPKPGAGNHIVYVGADCHPSLTFDSPTCTIYDVDPATDTAKVFARVSTARIAMIDGLYFDPTGDIPLRGTARPVARPRHHRASRRS